MTISALNRKLFRDVLAMKGQAFAIAMVVASGVTMYVTFLSNFASLRQTQVAYYEQQRFGDVFAPLKRAPQRTAARIADIPGVSAVETRVVAYVTLSLEQVNQPASGRLVSIPAGRRPRVNDLYLRRGRWIEPGRPDEVLASEGFASAHRMNPGDTVTAIIHGRLRRLTIVGIALSPEFIYSIRPGELVPDDKRFGIFWMDERALAAAFDMEGGFNDVALALSPGASVDEVIASLDRILAPYGGLGAFPRARQMSHWMLENELVQLQTFGFLLPFVFLLVAAFTLNVALSRALSLQRVQIAALKALGYSDRTIAWHYIKWALLIGTAGLAGGIAAGTWLGREMVDLYNQFFRFPVLLFDVPPAVVASAAALTLGAAGAGAFSAVRRAVRIPPAEAMRPEPPARYRRTRLEGLPIIRHFGIGARMVIRNVSRHPLRALASITGIASAVAILFVGLSFMDAMDRLLVTQFSVVERQDVTVSFIEPLSPDARYALARLPGVLALEPQRSVAIRIRSGVRERSLAITGVPSTPRLHRIVDRHRRSLRLPPSGVVLSQMLADALDVRLGDQVTIEVLEGARPVRDIRVASLVDDVLGLSVYMDMDALHAWLREGDVASGALLLVDESREEALGAALKSLPAVAGSGFKRTVLRNFRDTMAANMNRSISLFVLFAAIIAFGVVYNAARVSLSERSHELASLRVLGFTRAEISLILMGELALLTISALPAGWALGYGIGMWLMKSTESEVYRFPLYVSRQSVAWASLGVLIAAVFSGLAVRRRLDRLDLVAVLKVRE